MKGQSVSQKTKIIEIYFVSNLKFSILYNFKDTMNIKFIVEQHFDGYIAYPLGINGIVVGQGNSYKEALETAKSALRFHIDTFGIEVLVTEESIIDAFIEEEVYS